MIIFKYLFLFQYVKMGMLCTTRQRCERWTQAHPYCNPFQL